MSKTVAAISHEYRNLPLAQLQESPTNPRRRFDERALEELTASVRSQGVLRPLLVRALDEDKYEILIGARRFAGIVFGVGMAIGAVTSRNFTIHDLIGVEPSSPRSVSDRNPIDDPRFCAHQNFEWEDIVSCRVNVLSDQSFRNIYLGSVGSIIDNTEQQRAEEELRRRDLYLSEGQALSHTGSWAWNDSTQRGFWSPELFRILGLEPGALTPTPKEYLARVHPEDYPQFEEIWHVVLAERSDFDHTHRIVRPDGSIRHVRALGRPFPLARNELEFAGSVMDETEQHEHHCKMEKSLAEIQRLLEENIALRERSQQVAETLRDETAAFQRTQFEKIVGSSAALRRTLVLINQVAPTDATVLLMGDNGRK
jgi:PAS domain-containing protein